MRDARPMESEFLRNEDHEHVFLRGSPGYSDALGELRNHFGSPVGALSSSGEWPPNRAFNYI